MFSLPFFYILSSSESLRQGRGRGVGGKSGVWGDGGGRGVLAGCVYSLEMTAAPDVESVLPSAHGLRCSSYILLAFLRRAGLILILSESVGKSVGKGVRKVGGQSVCTL